MRREWVTPTCWFTFLGVGAIVAGGLTAAVTAHSPTRYGVWAVAYLVLVAGLAQVVLGVAQAVLATDVPSARHVAAELLAWNLGNAAVIAGTLADRVSLVFLGGALLFGGLILFVLAARGSERRWRQTRWAFRLVVGVLAVSIPVGLVLATTTS
ncbi:MAG: hypothetical protein ABI160_05505 [Mycobacteriaceae bacterium]